MLPSYYFSILLQIHNDTNVIYIVNQPISISIELHYDTVTIHKALNAGINPHDINVINTVSQPIRNNIELYYDIVPIY